MFTEFIFYAAARIHELRPTLFEIVGAFVTVEALPSVFSEDGGAGGGRETVLAGRVVGPK